MKTFYISVFILFGISLNAQIISIPDAVLKAKLLSSSSSNFIASNDGTVSLKIDANNNGEIEVSEVQQVTHLNLNNNSTSTNSSKFVNLTGIEYFTNLVNLNCEYNNIQNLTLSNLQNLYSINFGNNLISTINLTNLPLLNTISCRNNQLIIVDISTITSAVYVDFDNNLITSFNCNGLNNVTTLQLYSNQLTTLDISGMSNLLYIICGNNQISNFIFNNVPNLISLTCDQNQLNTLDVSSLSNLTSLSCLFNNLTSLTLCNSLLTLECSVNNLTNLNVNQITGLEYFACSQNQLTSLNVTGLNNLTTLECQYNQLQNLNLTGLHLLSSLTCRNNQLTTLDIRDAWQLNSFDCSNNSLQSLFMKNGITQTGAYFDNNPNLNFICADESEITDIQSSINSYGYNLTCNINSYCTFQPGGETFFMQGNEKLDANNNGCDILDMPFPNQKFSILGNSSSSTIIADSSGNYSIPVSNGNYVITPIIENPSYFTIFPTTITASFPTQATPLINNFCVSPNGIHKDIEIILIPLTVARPGFNTVYKIIYKNKGNISVSGTIDLSFNDAVLDLVSANPVISSQNIDTLIWNYSNLLPFESREILLTLNLNSPMETPPVNNGYQLDFVAIINPITDDELQYDNESALKQIVVGSLDPNDKVCIEGSSVGLNIIGQYVHYLIRFENTGTYAAENVVIKDLIDLAKFDINSLISFSSSHNCITKINGNKVEFIFENINLPFDDSNNDGYVAFKIITKSTLTLGDTFTNNASIYFDYNFPIITNTATTTIQTLSIKDFDFSDFINLYPNPAYSELNVQNKENISINSFEIYNQLGQLVIIIPNSTKTIDISNLHSGNYYLKVNSERGTSNIKFIKN